MKAILAIPLAVSAGSGASKRPAPYLIKYGRLLAEAREALGLKQHEVARLARYKDDLTVSRIEAGLDGASKNAAERIADALRAKGANIPPLVIGREDWTADPGAAMVKPMADPTDERIRSNLVRFRQAIGLDQFAAADATKIPYEDLQRYELGQEPVPRQRLVAIAEKYGCRPGDFFEDALPKFDASKQPSIHLGGPAAAFITDAERAEIERIAKHAAERMRAKKRR
jgi:transcriptional regulator with XRE-family HTH domain